MFKFIASLIVIVVVALIGYSIIGTESRVDEIKRLAPQRLQEANFTIIRYEGYERGSWSYHGGKVWYQVAEKNNPNIRYRVIVTLWNGETQLYYNSAENISNVQVRIDK